MHNKKGGCCQSVGGGKNSGCGGCCCHREVILSEDEKQFLSLLAETPFLPVTKFLLKSTKSDHIESVALAPVYLTDKNDSMETIKNTGRIIERLAEHNAISIDYDIPLENYDYSDYEQSDVFAYLKEMVAEGQNNSNFIFDTAGLQFGSVALTGIGQDALDKMDK